MTGSSVSFFIQKKTKKRKKTTLWWAKKQNLWKIDPDLNLTGGSILQLISDLLSKAGAKIDILSLQKKERGKEIRKKIEEKNQNTDWQGLIYWRQKAGVLLRNQQSFYGVKSDKD